MGTNSSAEELFVKMRKPYTITKQRERWTEEEHGKFLEALKLYGRAWQRIEEYIGTKTAVQIRSHAQKFFTKLEKESLTKGVPLGHFHDVDIPPPRPKRKPSNPYPRKISVVTPTTTGVTDGKSTSISSICSSREALDLENEPPSEEPSAIETIADKKGISGNDNQYEVLDNFQKSRAFISPAKSSSVSIADVLAKQCASREFVSPLNEINGSNTTDASYLTIDSNANLILDKAMIDDKTADISRYEGQGVKHHSNTTDGNETYGEERNEAKQPDKPDAFSSETSPLPRHLFVNFDHPASSNKTNHVYNSQLSGNQENKENQTSFAIPISSVSPTAEQFANSGKPAFHPGFPTLHHSYNVFRSNQESYCSFLNMSSTFSSLIISTLLQNPAVHAAATMAASFWPFVETPPTENILEGCPIRQEGQPPGLAAMVAATVAAASSWWALHGLLPFFPPPHTSYGFPPTTAEFPVTGMRQTFDDYTSKTDISPPISVKDGPDMLCPSSSLALKMQAPCTRPSPSPSYDTGENFGEQKASSLAQMPLSYPGMPDAGVGKTQKVLDRSSCGSNTTSSSDIETDRLEKHDEANRECKETAELIIRRCKSMGSNNDSRKEVSEEGRLAFQALFSREVLPQSFSHSCILKVTAHDAEEKIDGCRVFQADVMKGTQVTPFDNLQFPKKDESLANESNEEQPWTSMLIRNGKVKGCQTGFKPYKRCCMEANEGIMLNSSSPNEEKGAKRIRMEGEASTASR